MSTTDVSKDQPQWTCRMLTVEELLSEGEHLVYEVARTLYYLHL